MKLWLPLLGLLCACQDWGLVRHASENARAVFPGAEWATHTAEQVGLDPVKVNEFAATVGGHGVLVRDGYLIKSWGNADKRIDWASAAKPVISTMLLFAVKEGKLAGVDDPVRPFVQKLLPGKDLIDKDRAMTFRHLADMTSGYACGEAPGAAWGYNDFAIQLYARLLFDGVYGEGSADAAATHPKRLGALGFQDGGIFGSRKGYGVNGSPRDMARVGWFWLNRGRWAGRQVLPERFFEQYVKPDVPVDLPRTKEKGEDYLGVGTYGGGTNQTDLGPGIYGFNFWFNAKIGTSDKVFMPHLPPDAFQANGMWGRDVILVIPSLRLVVAASHGKWGGTNLANAAILMEAIKDRR